jgi:membrane protease YdiL (CAAX protease family)
MIKAHGAGSKWALAGYLALVLIGAPILGPILHEMLGDRVAPFHRAMDRALLIMAVGGLVLFRSNLDLRAWWPLDRRTALINLGFGLFIALVSVQAMLGAWLVGVGAHSAHLTTPQTLRLLATALTAAVLVPLLEETLFRGFLQTTLVRRLGWTLGWIETALVYALAHFLKIPVAYDHQPVHWWTGFAALADAFAGAGGNLIGLRALNLFLVGLILGGTFRRLGQLWFNYGLHGGWILGLLLASGFLRSDDPPRVAWLGGDLLGNLLTTGVLLLLGWWLWRYYPPSLTPPENGAAASSTSPSPGR